MLTDLFWRKLKLEMKLLHVVEQKPPRKIKLDPLTQDDLSIQRDVVQQWSQNNVELIDELLHNGMAQFICNKDYLYQFYRSLKFVSQSIEALDPRALRLSSLKVLNLSHNLISSLQNLPPNCKELYLDFNNLKRVELQGVHDLELLSASHNQINDSCLEDIVDTFPELRCLNLSYNLICKLKQLVNALGNLYMLKILISFNNPVSMLPIYYSYLTQHISLAYFDGSKYVKEEPKVEEPPPPPPPEKKEEDKKAGKKDNKKGGKVEEKAPEEPPPVVEAPKPVKKQLTEDDFSKVKMSIGIGNLEEHSGTVVDISLFPAEIDPLKTQTCYWIKYEFMGETVEKREQMVSFDASTAENNEVRLNMKCNINCEFTVNSHNYALFNQGFKVYVMQRQPKMQKDPQTLQSKPQVVDGEVTMCQGVLSSFHLDLRPLHLFKEKCLKNKLRLFPKEAIESPLFYDPLENEGQMIAKKKDAFEQNVKALEEQKLKKAQEEEQALSQKKGKDSKKATDKKTSKKDGKDATQVDKLKSEPCNFPIVDRLYTVVENDKMYKGKELLCLSIAFQ